ncbi:MAG: ABC transporter [Planctomycetaceae bacterium]|nr:ABC transporter [Planctomycetaceae bacterium]
MLRTKRAQAIQVLLLSGLTALVLAVWPTDAIANLDGSGAARLLSTFGYGLLVALILIAPAYPAVAIVRERQQGTLVLLLTSGLSPGSILVGKIVAAAGFVLLLIALSLPVAVTCIVMGGVSLTGQLLPLYLVLGLAAIQYSMLALLVSSYARTGDGAMRLTYGLILGFAVLTLVPYFLLHGKVGMLLDRGDQTGTDVIMILFNVLQGIFGEAGLETLLEWIRAIGPIPAVMELTGHGEVGSQGIAAAGGAVFRFGVIALVTTAGMIVWLSIRLRPTLLDRSRSSGVTTDDLDKRGRLIRRLQFIIDPQRRSSSIGPLTNPVMVKEFRCRAMGRSHWMARMIGFCLIMSLVLALFSTIATQVLESQFLGAILAIFQMGLIALLAPALSAGLVAGEVESGGWELMQLTPLSPVTIVVGKLASVFWTLSLLLVATVPGYVVLLIIERGVAMRVVNVLICMVLLGVTATLTSAACSSIFRRTAAATVAAYVAVVSVCVLTLLPWLGEGTMFGRPMVEKVLMVNPLATALSVLNVPGMSQYDLRVGNWWIMGATSVAALLVLTWRTWRLTRPK